MLTVIYLPSAVLALTASETRTRQRSAAPRPRRHPGAGR
jgi:hypothetical protein